MERMAKTVCVLGADTGVGKTTLTAILLAQAREAGMEALALKPFSSGGREDAITLMGGRSNPSELDRINPWHYRLPLAPLIAAQIDGEPMPDLVETLDWIQSSRKDRDLVLIEGAGGLLTPIAMSFTMLDVARELGSKLVVVVRNRLGAINQTRLCYEVLVARLKDSGSFVLSGEEFPDRSAEDNLRLIQEFCPGWKSFELPWVAQANERLEMWAVKKCFEKLLAQILEPDRNINVLCDANQKANLREAAGLSPK